MSIEKFKDGTVRYRNAIFGTECWYTPHRRHRPGQNGAHSPSKPAVLCDPQDYCSFCPAHYRRTTPEKGRLLCEGNDWRMQETLTAEEVFGRAAEFRRIGNLYEIISYDYWKHRYGRSLSPECRRRMEVYLSTSLGREHTAELLSARGIRVKPGDADFDKEAERFFGGSHDLIIPKLHVTTEPEPQLFSAGAMTFEEHRRYIDFSVHALEDIYRQNSFVRYVAAFTNWLRDAGATFTHLHRQIIGLDRFGNSVRRCLYAARSELFARHFSLLKNTLELVVCENDHAAAVVDIGRPFSTVAILSKQPNRRPGELSFEALCGVSDILHAVHAAFGADEPTNEEWLYPPPSAAALFPWLIFVKWRKNRHAGFEGITGMFTDVFRPEEIRDLLVERLLRLQQGGRLAPMRIGS